MKLRRTVTAGAAALATCGVLGMVPAAAQASSASDPAWTKQHPPVHPAALVGPSMAYDAATGTAVLFGGFNSSQRTRVFGDTWTWDGTTWTQQHPATSPAAREEAAMAYDAATGTAVLFGGIGFESAFFGDTWTWDGSTWTQQHPAASPAAREEAAMAYDAATGSAVLFGGESNSSGHYFFPVTTWTWG